MRMMPAQRLSQSIRMARETFLSSRSLLSTFLTRLSARYTPTITTNIYSIMGLCLKVCMTYLMKKANLPMTMRWVGLSPKRSRRRRSQKSRRLLNIIDLNHRQKVWFSVRVILRKDQELPSPPLLIIRIVLEVVMSLTWTMIKKKIFLTARIIWEDNLNSSNKSQTRSSKIKSLSIQMLLSKNKFLKFRSNKNSTTVPKSIDNWSWLI